MKNSRKPTAGFTLIELMAVITIIVILAGLVVGGMGYVNERQAREKAKIQIGLLEKALEEYKLDNGEYPMFKDTSGEGMQSAVLFQLLYGDEEDDGRTVYLPELDPKTNKQGWVTLDNDKYIIVDPWGNQYRYRSAMFKQGNRLVANTRTQNPDYDLWSVGKDGKTKATSSSMEEDDNRDDIRNF